uniref:Uncharacterized protein n=1 Tax=Knipowitschia caucasica TaxID=637954 RepID=A0AAV2JK66_KNICA
MCMFLKNPDHHSCRRVRADAQTSHSTHFLQLIRRNPEALPGQLRDTVPPTCPGSFLVSTKNITLLILKT